MSVQRDGAPVAWRCEGERCCLSFDEDTGRHGHSCNRPLYAAPVDVGALVEAATAASASMHLVALLDAANVQADELQEVIDDVRLARERLRAALAAHPKGGTT